MTKISTIPNIIHDSRSFYQLTHAINEQNQWKYKRKLLAMDIGTCKIGLSMSDDCQSVATPVGLLERISDYEPVSLFEIFKPKSHQLLLSIHKEHNIAGWIIGWPLPLQTGYSQEQLSKTNQFVHMLWIRYQQEISLSLDFPIHYWDERCSTIMAKESIYCRNRKNYRNHNGWIDQIVACNILKEYLDMCRNKFIK